MTKLRTLAEQTIHEAEKQLRANEQQMTTLVKQREQLKSVIETWQAALNEPDAVAVPTPMPRPVKKIRTTKR